ncbi:MAG: hypothetical protein KKB91_00930 [Proteobacteria bacterium]|jgi:hypothetical protein|nr:hypothetical protein [Desulfocapsa sp.]MBU3944672.1 hypothetical protein [Pseudomonadota bacterium]MCG2743272.1 hypothetical protein [Desulfobacteraceae bacterium]MBU4030319.1 hypothetical protein [Pseudomonadota bacterium]MBU4044089.1 hypothetical protein [Pseudomonadota bacterium]
MDIKSLAGKSAFDLFPDLFRDDLKEKKCRDTIPPPPPPDISWLADGMAETETSQSGDSVTALVVIVADHTRTIVEKVLTKMGYAVDTALSVAPAIQRLQAVQHKLIICGTEAALKDIHQYICSFPSTRRRETYYAIVGPHLHTLYDLEALTLSANLVINDKDLQNLENILHKGFCDYENLFRPFLDCLNISTSFLYKF